MGSDQSANPDSAAVLESIDQSLKVISSALAYLALSSSNANNGKQREKIIFLNSLNCSRATIASLLATTSETVRVELSRAKNSES